MKNLHYLKSVCSHLAAFCLGTIAVAVYHHWWVNPGQVQWIKSIAIPNTDIGYPGDWVLDILFPILPVFVISLILTVILTIISQRTK